MYDRAQIKVLIRNADGHYLSGRSPGWSFTPDPRFATIFDYDSDHIPEQLEVLRSQGQDWAAVPIDRMDRYEVCDQCGKQALPLKIFFDGRQFFCQECLNQSC